MKAMRLRQPGGLDKLYLGAAEPAAPAPGEIKVRVHASSLNYHDYLVAIGYLRTDDGRIPMSDGAGEVLEVGSGVREYKPGDSVVSTFFPDWLNGEEGRDAMGAVPGDRTDGFACEIVTRPAHAFTRVPPGYSHVEASTLTCAGLTAWRALFVDGRLKPGETVLVQGTGGVSIFGLQFAKAAGAIVFATSSSNAKLERLRALGADHVINYREEPEWGAKIMSTTAGRGIDHILEVGGVNTLQQSMIACRTGGHIAIIGVLAGFEGTIPIVTMVQHKRLRLEGVTVGSRREQLDMIQAIEANGIKPVIDHKRFPLEALAEAFRYQESGQHFGKICVDI
jgi:NADPH:quinone reductase-like Zn-dependent oxidoreductase